MAASETYNFNYDLATPPAPSEVGLDMFQKFMADPGQDINALLTETQAGIEAAFAEPVVRSAAPIGRSLNDAMPGWRGSPSRHRHLRWMMRSDRRRGDSRW